MLNNTADDGIAETPIDATSQPIKRGRGRPRKADQASRATPLPDAAQPASNGLPPDLLALLSDPTLKAALKREVNQQLAYKKLEQFKPYPVQEAFANASADNSIVLMLAANRVGKSFTAAALVAMHLCGSYPNWYSGRRFDEPVKVWAAGLTAEVVRDVQQDALIGSPSRPSEWGTGLIPKEAIGEHSRSRSAPDAIDTISIKHSSGGWSTLSFKAFSQGRERFQGTAQHLVWLDEEAPLDVFSECVMRTATLQGLTLLTFTPLNGYSELVTTFLGSNPPGAVIRATLDDALHFSDEQRRQMIATMLPHEREARSRGEPALGSGAVFPFTEEQVACDSFEIPSHWKRIAGIDFGFDHPTAAVKLAFDSESDVIYITHCYRERERSAIMHTAALKGWGKALPWAWPHDGLQTEKGSGVTLADQYRQHGLNLLPDRATDAQGTSFIMPTVQEMYERMESGRLKVFRHHKEWFEEMRRYHSKNGKVVAQADDLLSATRYGIMMIRHAETPGQWTDGPLKRVNRRLV